MLEVVVAIPLQNHVVSQRVESSAQLKPRRRCVVDRADGALWREGGHVECAVGLHLGDGFGHRDKWGRHSCLPLALLHLQPASPAAYFSPQRKLWVHRGEQQARERGRHKNSQEGRAPFSIDAGLAASLWRPHSWTCLV